MKYRIPDTATDEHFSFKNSTYSFAKTSLHILSAEERRSSLRWSWNHVDGENLPKDICTRCIETEMTRVVKFEADSVAGRDKLMCKVTAGINDSLVPRFTGSA
ncbi:hypothetical protein CPC08DRAFT_317780 [Agrocybe pediades]|nr:hypothetical protein CPC08DRAFT_317780 [Agrocybe pediades]